MTKNLDSGAMIEILIRARYLLIYAVSFEVGRVGRRLRVIADARKKQLLNWTITSGLELPDGSWITELKDPIKVLEYILQSDANALFVLRDYHHYLNDPVVVRKLRDAAHALKITRKNIIFLSPVLKVPTELEKEIAVIDYKLPDKNEITGIITKITKTLDDTGNLDILKTPDKLEKIAEAALGLTAEEAENVFAKSLVQKGQFDIAVVLSEYGPMRVHRVLRASRVNGPGLRFVLWVQGCSRHCPGCFNPLTHAKDGGFEVPVHSIIKSIPLREVEGISISGGEPFEQPEELACLLEAAERLGIHRLVYTGFLYEELVKMKNEAVYRSLMAANMLIDGSYQQDNPPHLPWTGSGNQRILLLAGGKIKDTVNSQLSALEYTGDGEIVIDTAGNITATGILDSSILRKELSQC